MSTARKVMVSELVQILGNRWDLKEKGMATFHQFGVGYEEFDSGPGNYSTAIVEWADGTVENVPVERIRFIDGVQHA